MRMRGVMQRRATAEGRGGGGRWDGELELFEGVIGVEEGVGGWVHGGQRGDGGDEDGDEADGAPEEDLKHFRVHCGGEELDEWAAGGGGECVRNVRGWRGRTVEERTSDGDKALGGLRGVDGRMGAGCRNCCGLLPAAFAM